MFYVTGLHNSNTAKLNTYTFFITQCSSLLFRNPTVETIWKSLIVYLNILVSFDKLRWSVSKILTHLFMRKCYQSGQINFFLSFLEVARKISLHKVRLSRNYDQGDEACISVIPVTRWSHQLSLPTSHRALLITQWPQEWFQWSNGDLTSGPV